MAKRTDTRSQHGMTWKEGLDAGVKLLAAVVGIFIVYVANDFQASLTTSNVLNQREQAESQLRAQMFGDLIRPLTASDGARVLSADQELLLAELLALNFHENFEFKPLLVHLDERLKNEKGITERTAKRKELRSVANRVMQRQVAILTRLPKDAQGEDGALPEQGCMTRIAVLPDGKSLAGAAGEGEPGAVGSCARLAVTRPGEQRRFKSPDGRYELLLEIGDINRADETVRLHFRISDTSKVTASPEATKVMAECLDKDPAPPWRQCVYAEVYREAASGQGRNLARAVEPNLVGGKFTLTRFDLPLTDHTLLRDGTRFSLFIDDFDKESNLVMLSLLWFPVDYVSPRERPWSHRQLFERIKQGGREAA